MKPIGSDEFWGYYESNFRNNPKVYLSWRHEQMPVKMWSNFFQAKSIITVNDVQGFRPTSCAGGHHNKENNQKAVANRQDDQKLIERWSLAFS